MSNASTTSDPVHFESELVRREIINRILYRNKGLARGLNHDICNTGPYLEDLVSFALSQDKKLQKLKARERLSFRAAQEVDHRRKTITLIMQDMFFDGEIFYLNGTWTLKVSTTDDHRLNGRRTKRKTKNDQRPYHGRPGRDRRRLPQFAAA